MRSEVEMTNAAEAQAEALRRAERLLSGFLTYGGLANSGGYIHILDDFLPSCTEELQQCVARNGVYMVTGKELLTHSPFDYRQTSKPDGTPYRHGGASFMLIQPELMSNVRPFTNGTGETRFSFRNDVGDIVDMETFVRWVAKYIRHICSEEEVVEPQRIQDAARQMLADICEPKRDVGQALRDQSVPEGNDAIKTDPDLTLRARTRVGDMEAFGALYERYSSSIYRYVYRRTGDHITAVELTSETFLHALEATEVPVRHFKGWLYRIAHNLLVDHMRAVSRRPTYPLDKFDPEVGDEHLPNELAEALSILPPSEDGIFLGQLRAPFRQLSPTYKRVIILRIFHELSVSEVAEVLGISEGAAKVRYLRAIRTLRKYAENILDS